MDLYTIGRDRKWLSASRIMRLRSKFRITEMQRCSRSVIVCEKMARVEISPAREHLFREQVTRNMARLHFLLTDRKDKT